MMFFKQYRTSECVLFCRHIVALVSKLLNVYCVLQFFDGLVVSTLHCDYFCFSEECSIDLILRMVLDSCFPNAFYLK